MMKRMMKRYENIERARFEGVGDYDIPTLEKKTDFDSGVEFISFNYASSCKNRENKGIHFFVDDYQFIRLWNDPDRYMPMLQQFRYVLTPDFSLYTDFPKAPLERFWRAPRNRRNHIYPIHLHVCSNPVFSIMVR